MLAYRYPIIAREGWMWIVVALVAAVVTHIIFGQASIPFWIVTIILVFLFRDPNRVIPASPLGVVSPVDGKVIFIDKVHDEYLERTALCISVKMSFTNVYSVHSPMEGKIMKQWLDEARKFRPVVSGKDKSTANNAKAFAQWIQSDEEDDVVLLMESSTFVPRPRCYAHSGERIGQGQRCGFLRFGARVDVLLPESSRIEVEVGEKIQGGSKIIASLVRSTEAQVTETAREQAGEKPPEATQ